VTYPGGRFSTEYPAYAGDDGMMAFINGQYSGGFFAGGMLGYVMDGKADGAWSGLEQRIELQREPLKLIDSSKLVASALSKAVSNNTIDGTRLGETEHYLDTHHLRLFHLLLPINS
jgi:hypothetical protein